MCPESETLKPFYLKTEYTIIYAFGYDVVLLTDSVPILKILVKVFFFFKSRGLVTSLSMKPKGLP